MEARRHQGSAIAEAERALQVANTVRRIHQRFDNGQWIRGRRFGPGGGTCLVGAIDEASRWTIPGVNQDVTDEFVHELPSAMRGLARMSPRAALMTYNDFPGGERRARRLVAQAAVRLGVAEPPAEGVAAPDAPKRRPEHDGGSTAVRSMPRQRRN